MYCRLAASEIINFIFFCYFELFLFDKICTVNNCGKIYQFIAEKMQFSSIVDFYRHPVVLLMTVYIHVYTEIRLDGCKQLLHEGR